MIISAIVARSKNNVIGIDNDLPWHLPADLKWFKEKTMGRHVIMGRKSYESLPGHLKGRTIIAVTKNKEYTSSRCIIKHSIADAIAYAKAAGEKELMILGGGMIYKLTQNIWDKLYITDVDVEISGDTTFAEIDLSKWKITEEHLNEADEKNVYNYVFRVYERKGLT